MRSLIRLLLLGCVLLTLPAAPTSASESPEPDQPVTAEVEGRLVLVLDSSGSMKEPVPGGGTRIEAAKQALTDVVSHLPDEAEVGIRVFGATVFSRQDKGACTDTQNVVPVGPLDRSRIGSAIEKYRPYGETPIGNALKGAAEDLGDTGKRTIVLLSDGEPTCAPDPCVVARNLRKQGVGLTVNVVGLDVSGAARRALQCVAKSGGGTYYDADDRAELAGSLVSVSVRALREFALHGTPVEGGLSAGDAVQVEPGQYTDTIKAPDTTRFYSVPKRRGWGVGVGVTARPETSDSSLEGFDLNVTTPAGASCGKASNNRVNALAERLIVSAGLTYTPEVSPYADETCASARRLLVEVTYERADRVDYELVVAEQPPVASGLAALPEPVAEPEQWAVAARAGGDPVPVVGGSGFADAPTLEPGVYTDTLRPGEQLLYTVPLEWGQAARVTLTVEADPRAAELLGLPGNTVDVRGFNPVRQQMTSLTYGADGVSDGGLYSGDQALPLTFATVPVRLKNADGGLYDRDVQLAGDYTVSIAMGTLDDAVRFAAPLRIEVERVGDVAGEPDFAEAPAPEKTGTSTPPEPQQRAAELSEEGDDSVGWLLPVGATVLTLVVVALGWSAMRRRRT